jgi:aryl-alcohol dehydrogenase-like predicted oxidoreductase
MITLGGDLRVGRIGYGAMRLTGPNLWGEYADRDGGITLLRQAAQAGVTLVDTADVYGPHTNELLIREALHPYPEHLVIATKGRLRPRWPGRCSPCTDRRDRQRELPAAVRVPECPAARCRADRPVLPAQRPRGMPRSKTRSALSRSCASWPVPGTTSIAHLRENLDAQAIELSRQDIHSIDSISPERTATQSPPSGNSATAGTR